jgi:hypothetical protein
MQPQISVGPTSKTLCFFFNQTLDSVAAPLKLHHTIKQPLSVAAPLNLPCSLIFKKRRIMAHFRKSLFPIVAISNRDFYLLKCF